MVRVVPFTHAANPIRGKFVDDALEILPKACKQTKSPDTGLTTRWKNNVGKMGRKSDEEAGIEILQSSFDEDKLSSALIATDNGLVHSIIQAYCQHHHLRIRAEDIWFAILSQINLYINANAEELRKHFVKHEGQKELVIRYDFGDRYSIDYGVFAREMTNLLDQNILDKEFCAWIMPDFSTTLPQDVVVASILMMGSMQKYFEFGFRVCCGIPSIELLGEKADYEKILHKLDYLPRLGKEPEQFAALLRPIMKRFIRTFDDPTDPAVLNFWRCIADRRSGSGFISYSGWMTAFCFWGEKGKLLYCVRDDRRADYNEEGGRDRSSRWYDPLYLSLDGVCYSHLTDSSIPPGWCRVPVTIDDNDLIIQSQMVAGSVGIACSSSGLEDASGTISLDTMQPEVGWWIYEQK